MSYQSRYPPPAGAPPPQFPMNGYAPRTFVPPSGPPPPPANTFRPPPPPGWNGGPPPPMGEPLPNYRPGPNGNSFGYGPTKSQQRHVGPSGPNGTWLRDDLVAEPEVMLNPEQLKIWKTFDNKEIDRQGLKLGFIQRVKSGTMDWAKWRRDQLKWKNMSKWIMAIFALVLGILLIVFKNKIVNGIEPFGKRLKNDKFGFLIPAGALFVLSFPPLFGHELIALIVGLVWGILQGWGIVSGGTLAGEIANYALFYLLLRNSQTKLENKSLYWAKLSRVSREGGFIMVLGIRYSVIPTHLSTTLFAACKINFFIYLVATILSQPRWLFHVYAGYLYGQAGGETKSQRYIFAGITALFVIITSITMKHLNRQMDACDEEVKGMLRQRRADALNAARSESQMQSGNGSGSPGVYNLNVPRSGHQQNPSASSLGSDFGSSTTQLNKPPTERTW